MGSSSSLLDQGHLTSNVRATSVGVTSVELFGGAGETNHKTDANAENFGENTKSMTSSTSSVVCSVGLYAESRSLSHPVHRSILAVIIAAPSSIRLYRDRFELFNVFQQICHLFGTNLSKSVDRDLSRLRNHSASAIVSRVFGGSKQGKKFQHQQKRCIILIRNKVERKERYSIKEHQSSQQSTVFQDSIVPLAKGELLRFLHIIKTGENPSKIMFGRNHLSESIMVRVLRRPRKPPTHRWFHRHPPPSSRRQ
jgi:hypothetical protein